MSKQWTDLLLALPGYDPFALAGDCRFDAKAGQTAVDFIQTYIRHAKGPTAGQLFKLQRWEKSLVANMFGWKRPDGTRRFREVFLYVGKKNGKTSLMAAIMLAAWMIDDELGAEFYSAAASRDQASLIFSHVVGMVKQEPELMNRLTIYGDKGGSQQKAVTYPDRMGHYRCLAADADTADGVSPSFVVVDELHRHKTPELADVLQKSTASRLQPLVIYTTTADFDRPSLCNEKLAYARSVRDNPGDVEQMGYDPAFLPAIFEASIKDDWKDPKTWVKANPSLGVTITEEFLRRECQKAQETPSELNNFLRLHLNIVTGTESAFISPHDWNECAGEPFDDEFLAGRMCFGALDLSTNKDLTCWGMLFPPTEDDPVYRILPRFFIPADAAKEREDRDKVPYRAWQRAGLITLTPGNAVDYEEVFQQIKRDREKFQIKQIGYDPWNAEAFAQRLMGEGAEVIKFAQSIRTFNEPTKQLEKLVMTRQIAHGGNPILAWMMGNAAIHTDSSGNVRPVKPEHKNGKRIDGVVVTVMALGLWMVQEQNAASVYETRGVLVL